MKLAHIGVALVIAGSLWAPAIPAVDSSELGRIESGVTSYRDIQEWWGQGDLVGRSGPECGAIRSRYTLDDQRMLELSWKRGRVCNWTLLTPTGPKRA